MKIYIYYHRYLQLFCRGTRNQILCRMGSPVTGYASKSLRYVGILQIARLIILIWSQGFHKFWIYDSSSSLSIKFIRRSHISNRSYLAWDLCFWVTTRCTVASYVALPVDWITDPVSHCFPFRRVSGLFLGVLWLRVFKVQVGTIVLCYFPAKFLGSRRLCA